MQFSGNLKGKTPILSKFCVQAPLGQNSTLPLSDQKSWIRPWNNHKGKGWKKKPKKQNKKKKTKRKPQNTKTKRKRRPPLPGLMSLCFCLFLQHALVCAIGGFTLPQGCDKTFVLFCKDTFEHPELQDHHFRKDHLGKLARRKQI